MSEPPNHEGSGLEFLSPLANDLNLNDAIDRAIFRGRVSTTLDHTRVDAMREWIGAKARDRYTVVRAVADAFIEQVREAKQNEGASLPSATNDGDLDPATTQAPTAMPAVGLFRLRLVEPTVGRRKPIARDYLVMAHDKEEAIANFDNEYGSHQREGATTLVEAWVGKVARLNTSGGFDS